MAVYKRLVARHSHGATLTRGSFVGEVASAVARGPISVKASARRRPASVNIEANTSRNTQALLTGAARPASWNPSALTSFSFSLRTQLLSLYSFSKFSFSLFFFLFNNLLSRCMRGLVLPGDEKGPQNFTRTAQDRVEKAPARKG